MSNQSSIRIIGGKWRSRKVSFKTKDDLRPTPDRVRETLFNWLTPYIVDANCLDLFAGSGVLGFEALSRGARQVVSIEQDRDNVVSLEQNKAALQAEQMTILNKDALQWLTKNASAADIVFVDPPYKLGVLGRIFALLEQHHWVHKDSLIYFEQDHAFDLRLLPQGWAIWRQSKAGNVFYYLAIKEN